MKEILKFVLAVMGFMAVACNEKGMDDIREDESSTDVVSHEMIVLGKQLEDPYSVGNVTKAIANLYPTKANRVDVTPTDIYVRFLPEDEQQYQYLVDQGYDLMDHPLDYQIVKDGDYYHDPEVDEEGITWQYAVLPKGTELPSDIRHEVLDECFIPDGGTKSDDGIDWAEVEREAYRITGNSDLLEPLTKGRATSPEGRITIVDESAMVENLSAWPV